jgi:hypothetical protein
MARLTGVSADLSCVNLVHTWPPEEQSRASRKASSSSLKSLTCTGARDVAVLMVHTRRGISPSVTGDLVRKFARCRRQTPRSAPCGIVQGRNVTQVGYEYLIPDDARYASRSARRAPSLPRSRKGVVAIALE